MQTVQFVSEVENAFGALGYSVLQEYRPGDIRRMTILLLRDGRGNTQTAVLAPAEQIRGLF